MINTTTQGGACKAFLQALMKTAPPKWPDFVKEKSYTLEYSCSDGVWREYLTFLDAQYTSLGVNKNNADYFISWHPRNKKSEPTVMVKTGARNTSIANIFSEKNAATSGYIADTVLKHYKSKLRYADFKIGITLSDEKQKEKDYYLNSKGGKEKETTVPIESGLIKPALHRRFRSFPIEALEVV